MQERQLAIRLASHFISPIFLRSFSSFVLQFPAAAAAAAAAMALTAPSVEEKQSVRNLSLISSWAFCPVVSLTLALSFQVSVSPSSAAQGVPILDLLSNGWCRGAILPCRVM
jgi:hypothetical protein